MKISLIVISFILLALIIFSFVGCGGDNDKDIKAMTYTFSHTDLETTEYYLGEELNYTGFSVLMHGNDNSETVLSAESYVFDTSNYNNSKAGKYTIEFEVLESIGDYSSSFEVEVKEMELVIENSKHVYNGEEKGIIEPLELPESAKIEYKVEGEYIEEEPTYKACGEYEVEYRVTKPNYPTYNGTYKIEITHGELTEFYVPKISIDLEDDYTIRNITKDDTLFASFSMTDDRGTIFEDLLVEIEGRGNSTWNYVKRPYKLDFDEKISFFGLEEAKKWVLLADYLDFTGLKNYSSLSFANIVMGDDYFSCTPFHVELEINGEYLGTYILTEHINQKEGRIDIEDEFENITLEDIEQGNVPFLIEMSNDVSSSLGSDYYYVEGLTPEPFEIKYPELKDRKEIYANLGIDYDPNNDIILTAIKNHIDIYLETLYNPNQTYEFYSENVKFTDVVDEEAYAKFFMINELFNNGDSVYNSIKMHRKMDGKITMSPVWDFDGAYDGWSNLRNIDRLEETAEALWQIKNSPLHSQFMEHPNSAELMYELFVEYDTEFHDFLLVYKNYAVNIKPYVEKNYDRWPDATIDYEWIEDKSQRMIEFLDIRYDFLKEHFENLNN